MGHSKDTFHSNAWDVNLALLYPNNSPAEMNTFYKFCYYQIIYLKIKSSNFHISREKQNEMLIFFFKLFNCFCCCCNVDGSYHP